MLNTETQTKLHTLERDGITWIDVQCPDKDTLKQLERDYGLHPIHLQETIQKVQHNQVEHEDGYLFLVMHFPVFHPHTDRITFGQVGIFLSKEYVITVRTARSASIANLFDESEGSAGSESFKHGAGYLLYLIIHNLLQEISVMTEDVIGELDEIEDLVFDNNASDAQRIGKVRQKIVRLMRIIGPKKIILQDLAEEIRPFAGRDMAKYYSINTKTANKLWEVIEEAKETVEIYKDADFTTSTEQTNEILAILTLIFTFTIPITVLGTLYGMNVPLPGGNEVGAWTFLGTYTTFVILVSLSLALAAGMYLYFKNKKWF